MSRLRQSDISPRTSKRQANEAQLRAHITAKSVTCRHTGIPNLEPVDNQMIMAAFRVFIHTVCTMFVGNSIPTHNPPILAILPEHCPADCMRAERRVTVLSKHPGRYRYPDWRPKSVLPTKISAIHHVPSCLLSYLKGLSSGYGVSSPLVSSSVFSSLIFAMLVLALLALPLLSTASVHGRHGAHAHSHTASKRLPTTWHHDSDHPGVSEHFICPSRV
jgi:hypothetical protein